MKIFMLCLLSVFSLTIPAHAAEPTQADVIKDYLAKQADHSNGTNEDAQEAGSAAGDLDGDGTLEIALVWTTLGPTYARNTITVFKKDASGAYQPAATLDLIGEAELDHIKNDQIYVDQKIPGPNDPLCCPSQKVTKRYGFDKDGIHEIQ